MDFVFRKAGMTTTYSAKLTDGQNKAFDRFESLTGHPPFGIEEFERGELSAKQLWDKNVNWLASVANEASHIQFPE